MVRVHDAVPQQGPAVGVEKREMAKARDRRWIGFLVVAVTAAGLTMPAASVASAGCLDAAAQRNAIQSGAVVRPTAVRRVVPGELIDLALCDQGGHLVYIATALQPDGSVKRVEVDARSGKVLGN